MRGFSTREVNCRDKVLANVIHSHSFVDFLNSDIMSRMLTLLSTTYGISNRIHTNLTLSPGTNIPVSVTGLALRSPSSDNLHMVIGLSLEGGALPQFPSISRQHSPSSDVKSELDGLLCSKVGPQLASCESSTRIRDDGSVIENEDFFSELSHKKECLGVVRRRKLGSLILDLPTAHVSQQVISEPTEISLALSSSTVMADPPIMNVEVRIARVYVQTFVEILSCYVLPNTQTLACFYVNALLQQCNFESCHNVLSKPKQNGRKPPLPTYSCLLTSSNCKHSNTSCVR